MDRMDADEEGCFLVFICVHRFYLWLMVLSCEGKGAMRDSKGEETGGTLVFLFW